MLTVSIILVSGLIILMFVVNFVLTNINMFQHPFDIVMSFPFLKWSHTWEGVEFMYIIAGSILLGALVIAISTWVLDTRRKLKLRSLRKELKRLQAELEKTKAELPKEEKTTEEVSEDGNESPEFTDSSSPSPEEITKSFEDAVQGKDFLQKSQKDLDEEPVVEHKPTEEPTVSDSEKQLPRQTPIEAEVVDSEEPSEEHNTTPKEGN